ncbi:hypothetical protein F5B19DRAFT_465628 [Rostrohypoxylon terebratum]|nr:hypothetical protein F5B19DRAFT_465628 [Rostrohypoxylon terebratum]
MAFKATTAALKRIASNVEVERKFNRGPKFTSLFTHNIGQLQKAPFVVRDHPGQLIRDTYYDTEDGHLDKMGVYVRQRSVRPLSSLNPTQHNNGAGDRADSEWNAKVRIGGHYSNSQFIEYDGRANVTREVQRIKGEKAKLEDLKVVSDLNTRRSEWEITHLADGKAPKSKMTVVIDDVVEAQGGTGEDGTDRAGFSHIVGEVEFFQELVTEDKNEEEHAALRKEVGGKLMKELEEFMLAHPDLFSTDPKPIGKLSAYETWKAERKSRN